MWGSGWLMGWTWYWLLLIVVVAVLIFRFVTSSRSERETPEEILEEHDARGEVERDDRAQGEEPRQAPEGGV